MKAKKIADSKKSLQLAKKVANVETGAGRLSE
jgi:hypothetical protein